MTCKNIFLIFLAATLPKRGLLTVLVVRGKESAAPSKGVRV